MILALTPRRTTKSADEPGFLTSGFLLAAPSHPFGQWQVAAVVTGYSGGGRVGFAPTSLN